MPFPYIFTFYSYKGGVGRSMAVMNVAYTLAGRGRHVLVVDMDLEAPGLSGFLQRSQELAEPEAAHPKDILTFIGDAIASLKSGGEVEQVAKTLPPLSNYLRSVAKDKLEPLHPKIGTLGRLDVLGIDVDRDYLARLAQLGLEDASRDDLVALSRLMHFYFKAQVFSHRPLGVEDFEPAFETHYDYVLVDSRTGITEIGGLCVGPLADRLVVITGLNDQNVNGTLAFLKEAGIQPKPRGSGDAPWDEADSVGSSGSDNPSLGPKPTILVASPVPDGEITYKRQRLRELTSLLGIRPVSLSYHPQMALMESVFVRDYRDESLADRYSELADRLMAQLGDAPFQLSVQVTKSIGEKQLNQAIKPALRIASSEPGIGIALLQTLAARHAFEAESIPAMRLVFAALAQVDATRQAALNAWGNTLCDQANTKTGEEADRFYEEAGTKYAEAITLTPGNPGVLNNWGNALSHQAKTKTGAEADRFYDEAGTKYAEAISLDPNNPGVLGNWGNALSNQAKMKTGAEADQLFEEAARKYAEAIRLEPGNPDVLNNWGAALSSQARMKAGAEADRLFEKAERKYADAIGLKPDNLNALINWGNALHGRAITKAGADANGPFEDAGRRYAEAILLRPDTPAVLNNWGVMLSGQANTKAGAEADQLFEEAGRKYREAIRLVPDDADVLNNWGRALSDQANTKAGAEADRLFEEAAAKYAEAICLNPDNPSVLNSLAATLLSRAAMRPDLEAQLLQEARQKCLEAERKHRGSASYNLARIDAREGNTNEAIRWLDAFHAAGGPLSQARLAEDKDFERIRSRPAFVGFVESLPEN